MSLSIFAKTSPGFVSVASHGTPAATSDATAASSTPSGKSVGVSVTETTKSTYTSALSVDATVAGFSSSTETLSRSSSSYASRNLRASSSSADGASAAKEGLEDECLGDSWSFEGASASGVSSTAGAPAVFLSTVVALAATTASTSASTSTSLFVALATTLASTLTGTFVALSTPFVSLTSTFVAWPPSRARAAADFVVAAVAPADSSKNKSCFSASISARIAAFSISVGKPSVRVSGSSPVSTDDASLSS
mmetsp:Transcript_6497/g.24514  ORF Transcript_6497/g.24514 Transcript_6497/m.24514 type:complete len:251 (-) Transcript_6497:1270-2022(-)